MNAQTLTQRPSGLRGSHIGSGCPALRPLIRPRHSAPALAIQRPVVRCAVKDPEVVSSRTVVEAVPAPPGKVKQFVDNVMKTAGVFAIACALMLSSPDVAEAARSGGRMGGSGFSSARSYGGGGMGGGGSGGMSSRMGGSSMGSSRLGGYGTRTAPATRAGGTNVIIAPSPFMGGWGMGGYGYGGYGVGAPMVMGGGGLFRIMLLGFFALMVVNVLSDFFGGGSSANGRGDISVVKIQVGLLGMARDIQADLEDLASDRDFDEAEDLHYLLQETCISLMRNPSYCVYGASELQRVEDLDAAEDRFNELSLKERGKFQNESLVNVAGRRRASGGRRVGGDGGSNEMIVVTILAAADSRVDLPEVNDLDSLSSALSKMGGLRSDGLLAVEVLWTPQETDDYLTRDEVMMDYPNLRTL